MKFLKDFFSEPAAYALIYILMFVYTFGYAFNHFPSQVRKEFAGIEYTQHFSSAEKSIAGLFSAAFWPLYWSIELQETK